MSSPYAVQALAIAALSVGGRSHNVRSNGFSGTTQTSSRCTVYPRKILRNLFAPCLMSLWNLFHDDRFASTGKEPS